MKDKPLREAYGASRVPASQGTAIAGWGVGIAGESPTESWAVQWSGPRNRGLPTNRHSRAVRSVHSGDRFHDTRHRGQRHDATELEARLLEQPLEVGGGPLAPAVLRAWGVEERVRTVAGSFFDEVPGGCDAYVLKEILHDWDDERCLAILGVCRRAMRPGATLLVMEMVLVDDDRPHPAKLLDMEMLDVTNRGRQRTAADFERLLEQTGFQLRRVVPLPSMPSVVESVAAVN